MIYTMQATQSYLVGRGEKWTIPRDIVEGEPSYVRTPS